MDSEHKVWTTFLVCTAFVLIVMISCIFRSSITDTNTRLQETKAAIAAGLCQEQNAGNNAIPGYHWTQCTCK